MKILSKRIRNLIFKFSLDCSKDKWNKYPFTLNYEDGIYRQSELVKIIRESVIHFALTKKEIKDYTESGDFGEMSRIAWSRISDAKKDKKGDYGELLLFIILSVFFPTDKLVTKVRLRTSNKDQIKGFDCAHFTVDDGEVSLWLGEAKFHNNFHNNFHNAVNSAISSINEHCQIKYLKDEISILAPNIELNGSCKEYDLINNILNGGLSIDKIKFKVPVLLTYDCLVLDKYNDIEDLDFINDMKRDFVEKFKNLENKQINLKPNLEVLFIIIPFQSISKIKEELMFVEEASK